MSTKARDIPSDTYRRRPVDRKAAGVVKPASRYVPAKLIQAVCAEAPLPMRAITADVRAQANFHDVTGCRRGTLTVVGMSTRRHTWVCRCMCGKYVHRQTRAICNGANDHDACEYCRHTAYLRHASTFRETGRDIDQEERRRLLTIS